MAILNLKTALPVRISAFLVILLISNILPKLVFAQQPDTISFIDDIPLMETMNVEPEFSFSFDSPSGRIIILIATSDDKKESVAQFYDEVMPQLGWMIKDSEYVRGPEKFQLLSSNNENGIIWRLSIKPISTE
jgi:Mg2+/Co2+ transporter CorB